MAVLQLDELTHYVIKEEDDVFDHVVSLKQVNLVTNEQQIVLFDCVKS